LASVLIAAAMNLGKQPPCRQPDAKPAADKNKERKNYYLSREAIKRSPEYTEEFLLTRDYEMELHRHYNRKGYRVDELVQSSR
jgi:hypothetical protein